MSVANEFDALLLEGIFSVDGPMPTKETFDQIRTKDIIVVDDVGGVTSVYAVLLPFLERNIQLSVHHWPPDPIQKDRWGGGCCYWESYGWCPHGHQYGSGDLVEMSGRGKLHLEEEDHFSLGGLVIPLDLLVGHRARVVLATVVDLEELKSRMGESWLNPEELEGEKGDRLRAET